MLAENETRSLIEFINKFFGLDLSENLKPIAISELNKFKKINRIKDLEDFLNKCTYDLQDSKILDLLEIFLIPHTNFFRNNRQFEALKDKVIPECLAHMDDKNNIDLRIWSAGCSTGEEAYSILISGLFWLICLQKIGSHSWQYKVVLSRRRSYAAKVPENSEKLIEEACLWHVCHLGYVFNYGNLIII